jgi:hypothetical protein
MSHCQNCGTETSEDSSFCSACGSKILVKPAPVIYCSICGARATNPAARFCSGCGSPIYPPTESASESSLQRPRSSTAAVLSPSFDREVPRAASSASFAHDVIMGVDLLPNERILRITPCKIKSFSQVKEGVIYTTSQRIVCTTSSSGMIGAVSKIRGRDAVEVESILQLNSIIKAEISGGRLRITFLGDDKRPDSKDYVIGSAAQDLDEFMIRARQGSLGYIASPLTDESDNAEVKSAVGKGLSFTGKALVQGAKIGAKLSNQLLQQYLNESRADFEAASREEDASGWSSRRGAKGRKAEGQVAEALRMTGWKVLGRNVMLQAREIDIIAQKAGSKYLIECKFGKKQINTAMLDSYVMLYYDAKKSMGVNGLLFVCPTAGMSEHAKGNVLIKYRGQNIQIVDSRNWVRELEAV